MSLKNIRLCGAKARRNNHKPCRQPAMKNGRCRLHGGLSTGPKTEEGKRRASHMKHGYYSKAAQAERKYLRMTLADWRKDLELLESGNEINNISVEKA